MRGQSGLFRFAEDPTKPGRYWFHYAPEFHSMNVGDLGYVDAAPGVNPEQMKLVLVNDTGIFPGEDAAREGHYRDALPLSDLRAGRTPGRAAKLPERAGPRGPIRRTIEPAFIG